MKQPCMEEFLGIKDRIYDNGKECIKLYKDFLKKRDAFTADEILGHNLEEVLGLGRIFDMLGYLCIYDGDYEVTYSEFDGDNLILKLKLPCTLPQEFSNGNTDFYLTGKDEEINLIIKTTNGKLKQYYADYKDYYYLPEEDTVIPKSLGSGIDRKHRERDRVTDVYSRIRRRRMLYRPVSRQESSEPWQELLEVFRRWKLSSTLSEKVIFLREGFSPMML